MKKLLMILVVLIFIAGAIGGAYAQFAKPEYAIKYRKAVMFLIAQHFGRMGAMVKEKVPYNQEVFAKNAMLVQTLSRRLNSRKYHKILKPKPPNWSA